MIRIVGQINLCLILFTCPFLNSQGAMRAHAQEADPIRAKLDEAKKAHDAAVEKFRQSVMDNLDKREENARREGNKKLLDEIKVERQQFDKTGQVPDSTPANARKEMAEARARLEKAYGQAIKDYTKSKRDDEATAVEKELDRFKRAVAKFEQVDRVREQLIGRWAWGENSVAFVQNGTATESNAKGGLVSRGKWKVEKDGSLLLESENGYSCRGTLREDGKLVVTCTAPTGAEHSIEATKKKEK